MLTLEIQNKYAEESDPSSLLYAPLDVDLSYIETRCYELSIEGDEEAAKAFALKTLSDPYSQKVNWSTSPALSNYKFYLDIGMKANTLDLEKEYLLKYQRKLNNPGFSLTDCRIFRRIYILGDDEVSSDVFVKDLVNPVIHTWDVQHA